MIIGVDEVGRGCWAGPLVAAAVCLRGKPGFDGLNDSKKLTAVKRNQLLTLIREEAEGIGLGWVWPREINKVGLTAAVSLAMHRSMKEIRHDGVKIVVDGNINYLNNYDDSIAIVGADGKIDAVSAASIVAKVARDAYMVKVAEKYPGYGFDTNMGYGTKTHIEGLNLYGVLSIHRTNYKPIKKFLQ